METFSQQLAAIEGRLNLLEHFQRGSEATYVGKNRVLKCVVAGHRIAYLVAADDRLLSPWFIVAAAYATQLTEYFVREPIVTASMSAQTSAILLVYQPDWHLRTE